MVCGKSGTRNNQINLRIVQYDGYHLQQIPKNTTPLLCTSSNRLVPNKTHPSFVYTHLHVEATCQWVNYYFSYPLHQRCPAPPSGCPSPCSALPSGCSGTRATALQLEPAVLPLAPAELGPRGGEATWGRGAMAAHEVAPAAGAGRRRTQYG